MRALLKLVICIWLIFPSLAQSQGSECGEGLPLQYTFDTGASWSLCAQASALNGLRISKAFYQAPGDRSRSVLADAQLSQILLHYHDSPIEELQIDASAFQTPGTRDSELLTLSNRHCNAQVLGTAAYPNSICQRIIGNGILSKYNQLTTVLSEAWQLSSVITRQTLTWTTSWTFTEDGQIRPRLSLSGRSSRRSSDGQYAQQTRQDIPAMTRASILTTWRMAMALDTDAQDSAQQFDFPLETASGNRRPMQISEITNESFRGMNRKNFRGWRVMDTSGAGYYLDPANNGFNYRSDTHNWANFALAFTRENDCELHATGNPTVLAESVCGANLDDFVNDEPLTESNIVVWLNQTRHLDPEIEDWPVIRDVQLGFDLLPFDWTATSPFELVD